MRERGVAPRLDRRAGAAHEVEVVVQVVDREEPRPERLAALEEVVQVRPRPGPAGEARAGGVERLVREPVVAAGEPDAPRRGEGRPLPRHRGGKDAVEHVDALADRLEEIRRGADAHEVARAPARQQLRRAADDVGALGARVAHREAADGEAVEGVLREEAGRLGAQRGIEAALHDGEEGLLRVGARGEAPQGPAVRAVHRLADGAPLCGGRQAHVEDHHHVGADGGLHLDRALGGEDVRPAVHVAAEARPLLVDRPVVREREDLEAAGVGEDGAVPAHEAVDPAHAPERLRARPEHEVVGVREDDLGAEGADVVGREAGDARARPDGHERRRLDGAVGGREGAAAGARPGVAGRLVEGEGHLDRPPGARGAPGGPPI